MPEDYTLGFDAIHDSLAELVQRDTATRSGAWTEEERVQVTALVRNTYCLLERLSKQGSLRARTHVREIEELAKRHLGHRAVLFEALEEDGDCSGDQRSSAPLDAFLRGFRFIVRGLAVEFPGPVGCEPEPGSPQAEKEYIARRLGRTRKGLESYVSKWRQRFGQDPPWVTRHAGTPWLPDVEAFERWRRTSEGAKATVRRRRGRPPST